MLNTPLILRLGFLVAALLGAIAVLSLVADPESNTGVRPWFFLAQIALFAYAGVRAAKEAPQSPITHGAAAASAGLTIVIIVTGMARIARGESISIIGIVFFLLLAASVGSLAAMIWSSRHAKSA